MSKKPQVGDAVMFHPYGGAASLRAKVVHVWSDTCVNLECEDGSKPTSVLYKEVDDGACAGYFCTPDVLIQPSIKGYRQLNADEAELMNEGKVLAEKVGEFIAKLRNYVPSTPEGAPTVAPGGSLDQRWISIGATQLQQGFMAVIRGIARPTTF